MPIRIAIVEDNEGTRAGLISLLERAKDCVVVASYPDGETALADAPTRQPDVVLMDSNLPQMSGADCIARLKKLLPQTQFIMLTVYEDDERLFKSLLAGANGYLLKRTSPKKLVDAIHEVRAGGSPMTPEIARRVVQYLRGRPPAQPELGLLTPREREVLQQLAQGFRYKEVSANLNMSMDTVRTHIRNIYDKLRVHSRTEAVMKLVSG